MTLSKVMLALLFTSGLVACGGGGSSSAPAPVVVLPVPPVVPITPFATAGVYDVFYGQFHGTYTFLDNGEFYGLHFVNGSELAGHPRGLLSAANTVTNRESIAWANFIDDALQVGQQEAAGVFGRTFGASDLKVSITGSMGTFTASASTAKLYGDGSNKTLYGDPIALTALAGSYHGTIRTAGIAKPKEAIASFAIDATGNVTASAVACTFNGKMIQHGTTGIFDLQLAAAGVGCTLNPVLKGVVTPMSFVGGVAQLAVMVDSLDKMHSAVFMVTKG